MPESENKIDLQEVIQEISQDPWCKLHVDIALYKITTRILSEENQELKKEIEGLNDKAKVVSK